MQKTPAKPRILFVKTPKKPVPPIGPKLDRMVRALNEAGLKVVKT